MKFWRLLLIAAITLPITLTACGGGGGGLASVLTPGGGGIGGTGVTSSGTIDGFGSIFVNGVEFETGTAAITVDGQNAGEDALRLGMVVLVTGTLNDDGVTGTASRVVFNDEVQGPVTKLQSSRDGDTLLLRILGVEVIVERTSTVFDGVRFDTLAVGDLLEVSGFRGEQTRLRATRIEKKSAFVAGASVIELAGEVGQLAGTRFELGEYQVEFSGADLSAVSGGNLVEGTEVEVRGTLRDGVITADRIREDDELSSALDADTEASVQGLISGFVDAGRFRVNGVNVDAGGATLEPAGVVLRNGLIVEVEGAWNGNVLVARELKSRRGRAKLEAAVAAIDAADNTITLQYASGTVTVRLNQRTLLEDDTRVAASLRPAGIAIGDFLEIEAIQVGNTLVATRIDRESAGDDILQAQVESFTAGAEITLLGISFATAGADFENRRDDPVSAAAFYQQLRVGDLVKIKDEETADGLADEVEFEQADRFDGELEFDDGAADIGSASDDDGRQEDDGRL